MESKNNKVYIEDIVSKVDGKLQETSTSIKKDLGGMSDNEVSFDRKTYLVNNYFWDKWIQKFFAQLISIKLWCLVTITVLLVFGILASSEYIIGFGIVMGAKGGKDIVSRYFDRKNFDVVDKV